MQTNRSGCLYPLAAVPTFRRVVLLSRSHARFPIYFCVYFQAQIPQYLYPFLSTSSTAQPFEFLRLTSLGVIGALVKVRTLLKSRVSP